jgi:uncharacterized membrane protein
MAEIAHKGRLDSIDFMRGLVIVIMAIDHTRDLLHIGSMSYDPLDLNTTTPVLFLTRWITHICAPVFVFLAGVSAFLALSSQNDISKTRKFLRSRGLWLVFLEFTVIGFGIWFDIYFRTFLLQVIFTIGMGLFILSFLLKIPARIIGLIGLSIIVLHNLTSYIKFDNEALKFVWALFFERGFFKIGADRAVLIAYPVVPWLGILLFGFGFGTVFRLPEMDRGKIFLKIGVIALLLFVTLRSLNLYGDPSDWSVQPTFLNSFFSFIKLTKYPPSLLYTAITLCIMFFLLYWADKKNNRLIQVFVTYGRVPLFFYILHWYIIHLSMFIIISIQGVKWEEMPFGVMNFGRPETGAGLELPFVYLYWISLVICMYPLCLWYGKYKALNKQRRWLKYI